MKNKRSLKIMVLAAMTAVVTLLCSSCGKKEPTFTGRVKTFAPGTHVISTPLAGSYSPAYDNVQFDVPEGYRAVGMGVTHGGTNVILYENIVPVECAETKDGYTEIGIPVEQEKEMTLEKEN